MDRRCSITSGGTDIEAAIAKSFAEAKASGIGIISRRENLLQSSVEVIKSISPSTQFEYPVAELTDEQSLKTAFDQPTPSLGKIDILISNAGHLSTIAAMDEADAEDWWQGFEVHVKGSFNAIRDFLPNAASNATVVSVNAGMAVLSPIQKLSSYVPSKVANAKIHEILQVEHLELYVVSVHPGVMETARTEKVGVPGRTDRMFPMLQL